MTPERFHLVSHWRVRAPARSVFAVLADLGTLSSWWPGVRTTPLVSSANLVGRRARIEIAGLLPIALHADVEITAAQPEREIAVVSHGQLQGRGEWRLREASGITKATFTWDVWLEHPKLQKVAHWLRPLLLLSHRFAMWRGERGLRQLLETSSQ
jgi:hypothetical protein